MRFDALRKHFPSELRDLAQWVVADKGKRPLNPANGRAASVSNPKTWGSFDEACATALRLGHPGVGFVLTKDDPYCIVDLDDKPEKPASDAERERFASIIGELDSYTERSRSGRGFHVVVEASLSKGVHRGNVEIYSDARYMVCTGDVVNARPVAARQAQVDSLLASTAPSINAPAALPMVRSPLPDAELLERIAASSEGGGELLACEDWLSLGYDSQSSADLALMNVIAQHTDDDEQAIRVFRACPLGQRDKAQRNDYMRSTLAKARQGQRFSTERAASLFSDTANAHRIVHHMGQDLLFVPGIGWHVWDGARWRADQLEARRHAGKLGRIVLAEAATIADKAARIANRDRSDRERELAEKLMRYAGQAENVAKIEAAMRAAEPLLRCDVDNLDADPWAVGCANGVVDLRTGELRTPQPSQLITKSTGIAFDSAAECVEWTFFLQRIFRSHAELPDFLQLLAGYWLTGLTDPPFLAVLYGVGANGKSTLVHALSHALGEYASAAPPGLLMSRYGQHHPTELAALQGRRFVVAAESGEGGRLDEERIKLLTGSDAITARRMREDFYTFRPTHKLALMTNHKPIVRGMDEGIWRRLLLIPFDEVIPEAERDPALIDRLRAEGPGILRWAVEGAAKLARAHGRIDPPPVVTEATRAYRTESDVLGAFLAEECVEDAKGSILAGDLYVRYETWCEDNGERALSKRALGLRLQERGFVNGKDRRGARIWKGLTTRNG